MKFSLILLTCISFLANCATPLDVEAATKKIKANKVVKVEVQSPAPPMLELKTFDTATIRGIINKLGELDGTSNQIWIRINTNGGSINNGHELIQFLEGMKSDIVCVVDTKAYSMGFYLLESSGCDYRYMTKRSTLMAHEPLVQEASGNAHELRNLAEHLEKLSEGFVAVASERMHMSEKDFKEKINNTMWWLSYKDAEQYHAIDGFVDPKEVPKLVPYEVKKSLLEMLLGE